jgi:putative tricarboxylic transport membrane protein
MMERNLRTALEMSAGDLSILVTRPISAFFLAVSLFITVSAVIGLTKGRLKNTIDSEDY